MEAVANNFFKRWYQVGFFNLLLVAVIGLLLRYKILASLPGVNHKYFLHGHSHFAFAGWVSLIIMVAIVHFIYDAGHKEILPAAKWILIAHLVSAYGMLLVFPIQGYAPLSIAFSTLNILVSYYFVIRLWKYSNKSIWGSAASRCIRAAMVFLVLSSVGAFWLAGLMASHSITQSLYFSALYFFLHFQYNGWFFFGIAGIWLAHVHCKSIKANKNLNAGIKYLIVACVPAVILSGLWMSLPGWAYWLAIGAALLQVIAVIVISKYFNKLFSEIISRLSIIEKWLYGIAMFSFLLRILLQALSVIPALGKFAFAYRPVVIGYLHLILLGCISFFLIAYLFGKNVWNFQSSIIKFSVSLIIMGFLMTELTLMFQGFGYIGWISIPYIREALFLAAVLLFGGITLLVSGFLKTSQKGDFAKEL
jgi:hypothetical protein